MSTHTKHTDIVLHPIRLRVLRALAGKRLTTRELLALLKDVPQASLYRHIGRLVDAGIVVVCDENKVKGTTERIYTLPMSEELVAQTDWKTLTKEDHLRMFNTFISTLLNDYSQYLGIGELNILKDQLGYRTVQLFLTDAELTSMLDEVKTVVGKYLHNHPAKGRRARNFSTVLITEKTTGE